MSLVRSNPLAAAQLAVLAAVVSAGALAAIPEATAKRLTECAPVAFYGMPAVRQFKVSPLVSDEKRSKDRKVVVDLKTAQLVLHRFSEDLKCAEVTYPVSKSTTFAKGWFLTDDVLSLGKGDPTNVTAQSTLLLFGPEGKRRPVLVGCADKGVTYLDFGRRKTGREELNLVLVGGSFRDVNNCSPNGRLAYAREQGPLDDESTYPDRVADFMSEESYQPGLHWDNDTHPMLVNNGNGGCAAFVTDFAKYVFGAGNFNEGERFDKASEIRAGDVIALDGHFVAVLFRDGDKLTVMDGNCNSAIRFTDKTFSVVKGEWTDGGKGSGKAFLHGFHYLKAPPPRRKGKTYNKK